MERTLVVGHKAAEVPHRPGDANVCKKTLAPGKVEGQEMEQGRRKRNRFSRLTGRVILWRLIKVHTCAGVALFARIYRFTSGEGVSRKSERCFEVVLNFFEQFSSSHVASLELYKVAFHLGKNH
jgi:hypothetical protein